MKNFGISLVILGGFAIAVGVAGLVLAGDSTIASTLASATTLPSGTSTTTTTTMQPTTTTTQAIATTTDVPAESLEAFVSAFRAALDTDDAEFVMARLHPEVVAAYGAELCRSWVEREILTLEEYELTGQPSPVADQQIQTPGGSITITDMFSAPIRFVFQGQTFDSEASFAFIGGLPHWMGECR